MANIILIDPDLADDDPDRSWDTITRNKHKDNEHSLAAAASITPQVRASIRERVMSYLAGQPKGATYEEVMLALGLYHPTVTSAITVLKKHGLIQVRGGKRTSRGRMAAIYFITSAGAKSPGGGV